MRFLFSYYFLNFFEKITTRKWRYCDKLLARIGKIYHKREFLGMANTGPHLKRLRCVLCQCVSLPTNVKSTNPATKRPKYKFRQKKIPPIPYTQPSLTNTTSYTIFIQTTPSRPRFSIALFSIPSCNTGGLRFLAQMQHPSPLSPLYFSLWFFFFFTCFTLI